MALRDMVKTAAEWLKYKVVYTAEKPKEEFVYSGSMSLAKQSVYDAMTELTSSTPMSSSIILFNDASSINRDTIGELRRMNDGLYASACRSGSVLIHSDHASGSGVFVTGSYYRMTSAHGQSIEDNFEDVKDVIEHRLREKISIKKGKSIPASEASASRADVLTDIRSLPS